MESDNSKSDEDILGDLHSLSDIDLDDIELIRELRKREKRPMADPNTDIGTDPLIPLKNRKHYLRIGNAENITPTGNFNQNNNESKPCSHGAKRSQSALNLTLYQKSDEEDVRTPKENLTYRKSALPVSSSLTFRVRSNSICEQRGQLLPQCLKTNQYPLKQRPDSHSENISCKRSKSELKVTCTPISRKHSQMMWSSTKRKFMKLLKQKMDDMKKEINLLHIKHNEIKSINLNILESTAKMLAKECTDFRYYLTELNLVHDMHTFNHLELKNTEINELKNANQLTAKRLERIYSEKMKKTKEISLIEKEMKMCQENLITREPILNLNYSKQKSTIDIHSLNSLKIMEKEINELNQFLSHGSVIFAKNDGSDIHKSKINVGQKVEYYLNTIDLEKTMLMVALQEEEIVNQMKILSIQVKEIPTEAEYENIIIQTLDISNSVNDAIKLREKLTDLLRHHNKLKNIDKQISKTLKFLNNKIKNIQQKLKEFKKDANQEIQKRENELIKLKNEVNISQQKTEEHLKIIKSKHGEVQTQLMRNKNHLNITRLEQKLQSLAQAIYFLSENEEQYKAQSLVHYRKSVIKLKDEINYLLKGK